MINGLGGDRVRIQVDGIDLIASCPNHMNPPLSYVDPSAVESLKVYAGISPVSAGDDKRYWYGALSNSGPNNSIGIACAPLGGGINSCAAGMPMTTESKNSGLTLKADIALDETNLLRIGSEYQHYRLDDWWPPSGGGMWPNAFININDGKRKRSALFGEWEATHSP